MMTLSRDRKKLLSPWAERDRNLMQGDDHRSGGRFMELSKSDRRYISEQISRYNDFTKRQKHCQGIDLTIASISRLDCLWRIASCAELFTDLSPTGCLTDNQWNATIDFIEQFQGGQR